MADIAAEAARIKAEFVRAATVDLAAAIQLPDLEAFLREQGIDPVPLRDQLLAAGNPRAAEFNTSVDVDVGNVFMTIPLLQQRASAEGRRLLETIRGEWKNLIKDFLIQRYFGPLQQLFLGDMNDEGIAKFRDTILLPELREAFTKEISAIPLGDYQARIIALLSLDTPIRDRIEGVQKIIEEVIPVVRAERERIRDEYLARLPAAAPQRQAAVALPPGIDAVRNPILAAALAAVAEPGVVAPAAPPAAPARPPAQPAVPPAVPARPPAQPAVPAAPPVAPPVAPPAAPPVAPPAAPARPPAQPAVPAEHQMLQAALAPADPEAAARQEAARKAREARRAARQGAAAPAQQPAAPPAAPPAQQPVAAPPAANPEDQPLHCNIQLEANIVAAIQEAIRAKDAALDRRAQLGDILRRSRPGAANPLPPAPLPDYAGHTPLHRLSIDLQESIPSQLYVINQGVVFVANETIERAIKLSEGWPDELKLKRQAGGARGINYDKSYDVSPGFDRNMLVQEMMRRPIHEGTLKAIRDKAEGQRSTIEKYLLLHDDERVSEERDMNGTAIAPSIYPKRKFIGPGQDDDGSTCNLCGRAATEVALYKLHKHTIKPQDNDLLNQDQIDQGHQFIRGNDPANPRENDYWCSSCYLEYLGNDDNLRKEGDASCPVRSCLRDIPAYNFWRMILRASPGEKAAQTNYLVEIILEKRAEGGQVRTPQQLLESLVQLGGDQRLLPLLETFFRDYDEAKARLEAQKQKIRADRQPGRPVNLPEGNAGRARRRLNQAQYNRQTNAQVRAIQVNYRDIPSYQPLYAALPNLKQRLQNILAKRRSIKLETTRATQEAKNAERLQINTVNFIEANAAAQAACDALRTAADTERQRLAAAADAAARAALDQWAAGEAQRVARVTAEFDAGMLRYRTYQTAVARLEAQKREELAANLDVRPNHFAIFCPYCAGFVGERMNEPGGQQVACRFIYQQDTRHNHNGIRGRRAVAALNRREPCNDICSVCSGPTCFHDHITLSPPGVERVAPGFGRYDLCTGDDRRVLGGALDRACLEDAGGGVLESVARILGYRDLVVEKIRESPDGFDIQFPDLAVKADEYARIVRGSLGPPRRERAIPDPNRVFERAQAAIASDTWDNADLIVSALGVAPAMPNRAEIERRYPQAPRPAAAAPAVAAHPAAVQPGIRYQIVAPNGQARAWDDLQASARGAAGVFTLPGVRPNQVKMRKINPDGTIAEVWFSHTGAWELRHKERLLWEPERLWNALNQYASLRVAGAAAPAAPVVPPVAPAAPVAPPAAPAAPPAPGPRDILLQRIDRIVQLLTEAITVLRGAAVPFVHKIFINYLTPLQSASQTLRDVIRADPAAPNQDTRDLIDAFIAEFVRLGERFHAANTANPGLLRAALVNEIRDNKLVPASEVLREILRDLPAAAPPAAAPAGRRPAPRFGYRMPGGGTRRKNRSPKYTSKYFKNI